MLAQHPALFSAEPTGKYLPWDELRRRTPPPGITLETWWAGVRTARALLLRPFPLDDDRGRAFMFAMPESVQRMVHEIDRDASGRIELPEDVTNKSTRDRYVVSSLMEEAITSSQLEGASTTRHVAKEMLRSNRPPRTAGERMILNNFLAMEWVRENVRESISVDRLLDLHRIVTHETLESGPDGAGRFRRADEHIRVVDVTDGETVHEPPHADTLPARVEEMCRFANSDQIDGPFIHPVVRAILLHFWLAYDHPFVDGNGRTARALFYWSMLRQGYWLTEFLSISRVIKKAPAQYSRAFQYTEHDSNDATYFVVHQLGVLRRAIEDLFAYLQRKTKEVRDVEQQLRGRDDLNHRQIALLGHALRHADARYTIEAHQKSHQVVYQTARTDLLSLAKHGLLEQHRIGKKLHFIPAKDLDRRLRRSQR